MKNSLDDTTVPSTQEDLDLLHRSTKKIKNISDVEDDMHVDHPEAWPPSYKCALQGPPPAFTSDLPSTFLQAEEVAPIDSTAFIPLSTADKVRWYQPWLHFVIVKTYGKTVGYKFLSSKLPVLWQLTEPLHMVDLVRISSSLNSRTWTPIIKSSTRGLS